MPDPVELMRTAQVAEMLCVSDATVRWWRHVQQGPPSFKVCGAVRYRRCDVETWLAAQYDATVTGGGSVPKVSSRPPGR